MERVHRFGIVSLLILLLVATLGLVWGGGGSSNPDPVSAPAYLDATLVAEFAPPEKRQPSLTGASFSRPPAQIAGTVPPAEPAPRVVAPPSSAAPVVLAAPLEVKETPSIIPPRVVRVGEGDTLSRIAERELGSSRRWREIAALNPAIDPDRLAIGQALLLPEKNAQPVAAAATEGSTAPSDGLRRHIVAEGETLGDISQTYYGTARRWQEILRENGIEDPKRVRAGSELIIP